MPSNQNQRRFANVRLALARKMARRQRLGKLAGPLTKPQLRELGRIGS